jgi:hypothetical protein
MGTHSLVASLQLHWLWLNPVIVQAAALLTALIRPNRIVDYAHGDSFLCRLAATPLVLALRCLHLTGSCVLQVQ